MEPLYTGAMAILETFIPRALSSSVQRLISSWTSSASTVLRVYASSHRGF